MTGAFLFAYSPTAKALTSWSDNALTVLGVRDVAITRDGNVFLRHVHPDDRFSILNDLERALAGASEYRVTYRWIRPDTNAVRWLHCRAGLVSHEGGTSFEGFIIDLSEEFIHSSGATTGPEALQTVLAALPSTVITLDRDARIVRLSHPAGGDFPTDFGDPNFRFECLAVGRSFFDGFVDEERRLALMGIVEAILTERTPHHAFRASRAGKIETIEFRPLTEHGAVVGALVTIADATPLVSLEQRVSELQLAEGLRTVSTGVVHNFNNALQRIIGQAVLLGAHTEEPAMVEQVSDTIIEIAGRTGDLTRQLLAFEDACRPESVPLDLNVVTMAAVNRIKDLFSNGLQVSIAFGAVEMVRGHRAPLVRVIERAIRVMRDHLPNGSSLAITTTDGCAAQRATEKWGGACLTISEASNGSAPPGRPIESEVISDLAACFAGFGGTVSFATDDGGRQRVTIELPSGESIREVATTHHHSRRAHDDEPQILIVDDDTMVLETIEAVLRDLDCVTVSAADAGAALDIVRRHGASLRLALVDAVMPGMDGATLLRRITRRAPHIKVLGFSGAPQHITDTLLEAGALRIIRKPAEPHTLRDVVRDILRGRVAA